MNKLIKPLGVAFIIACSSLAVASPVGQASDMHNIWKSLGINEAGTFEHQGKVFIQIIRPWNLSSGNQHRRWAELAVGKELARFGFSQCHSDLSEIELKLLAYSDSSIKLSGHVVFSGKLDDEYRYVFGFSKSNLKSVCSQLDPKKEVQQIANKMIADSSPFGRFFVDMKNYEMALLSDLRSYRGGLFSVSDPVFLSRKSVDKATAFLNVRDELLASTSTPNSGETKLLQRALDCSNNIEVFLSSLNKFNIKTIQSSYKTPILSQVATCQGFATFRDSLSNAQPLMMPRIKQLFKEGRDIELAIYLLEQAVEESPRNTEVWEYLASAYKYAGLNDKATLATRVWFIQQDKVSKEAFFKVLKNSSESQNEKLFSYFEKFQ